MTSADKAVQDVTAQLTKAKGEIDAEVAKLQDAGVSPESLAGLQAVSQSLDDANPDAAPAPAATDSPGDVATNDTSGTPDGATDTSV